MTQLGTIAERRLVTYAEVGIPSVHAKPPGPCVSVHCSNCSRIGRSCYIDANSECFCWRLQAQGWHRKENRWRCLDCHWQAQRCLDEDLGQPCRQNGHGIAQHSPELADHHRTIEDTLDVAVAQMIGFGFITPSVGEVFHRRPRLIGILEATRLGLE